MNMQERLRRWCSGFWCATAAILLVVFGIIVFFVIVAINSVAGLDPGNDLGRPTVDPEFKLTVGVASWAFLERQCADHGMKVEVSYRGVLLATSEPVK